MQFRKMLVFLLLANLTGVSTGQVTLLKEVKVSGKSKDKSGDSGNLEDGTPADQLGGPSGMVWTGQGMKYLWLSDRGPKDGATSHTPRFHWVDLENMMSPDFQLKIEKTVKLKSEDGKPLTGRATAIDSDNPEKSDRFDPEGIALWEGKTIVSDEYGPVIRVFDKEGKQVADWPVPERFRVNRPSGDEAEELTKNKSGRQPNAGFEGLCSDGNGGILAILQRPLLQDGGVDASGKRVGTNVRILNMCGPNCKPRELVYTLDDKSHGISEICHLEGSKFLAIERDGKEAKFKKIIIFDISNATDISSIERLPGNGLPASIIPVRKRVLIDLLDPKYGLGGKNFPEKIEGLAKGPEMENGQKSIFIASDNDFEADEPICIWCFAISPKEVDF